MKQLISELLPWLLSLVTIVIMWQAGSNWRWTWVLSTANQALWLVWILATGTWGLLPMNIALWVVSIRNHHKWRPQPGDMHTAGK